MISRKGSFLGGVMVLILLIMLGVAIYLLYLNLPSEPVEYETILANDEEESFVAFSKSKQFYDNMRYKDRKISYRVEKECDIKKTIEVERALSTLEEKTVLEFYPMNSEEAEIIVFCSEIEPLPEEEGYFVAGEGGPTAVINTTLYGVILFGKISFFREEKCENPNIALHELLHALGFDHNNNKDSVLYPTLDCKQTIDESIISDINDLYSVNSLADLKIINVDATKSGRYLSFKIEVINRGLQNVNSALLSVHASGELVREFDLNSIDIGTRKFLEVTNLRIPRSSDKIIFIVDEKNTIAEIFEENNRYELKLLGSSQSPP